MKFKRMIDLLEQLNLSYSVGFSDNLFPLNIEYYAELTKIKNKIRSIAKKFKFDYVGRADRSLEYQRKSDGLGFRIGISGIDEDKMSIVLIPDENMKKFFDSQEIKITKERLSLDQLIKDLDSGKLEDVLEKTEADN